jgi:type I restriction enzyme, S subunit
MNTIEWRKNRLRFVCKINPSRGKKDSLPSNSEVSFVPMEAVSEKGSLSLERTKQIDEVSSGYTYFENGDVVFAKITPCFENGKGALANSLINGIAFGTTELHVLRPFSMTNGKYIYYLVSSELFRKNGESYMYGAGGQKRVPEDFVKDFQIFLPPLPIQKAIASYLDKETVRIDALIEKKERQIELLQEKRQAIITRAVTKGLKPNAKMKDSGIEWIGEIPEGWKVQKLKHIVKRIESGTSVNGIDNPVEAGKTGVLKTSCVSSGRFLPNENKEVVDEDIERVSCPVRQGSMIINRANTPSLIARSGYVDDFYPNLYLSDKLWQAIFDSSNKAFEKYTWYFISCEMVRRYISLFASGTSDSMKNISKEDFQNSPFLKPPAREAYEIVRYLEKSSATLDSLESAISLSIAKLREYRSSLITAAVSGHIEVPQEDAT